jgi:hypothetical protein
MAKSPQRGAIKVIRDGLSFCSDKNKRLPNDSSLGKAACAWIQKADGRA